ncbi:head-closure protein [Vibrio phage 1.029.O._10N.261.55.A7]|nr:head-closure protein [Vibrio phage 1.029.O._10N.261.55.A7]
MISMLGFIDQTFATHTVTCTNYEMGDYDDRGEWQDGEPKEFTSTVNLQPVDRQAIEFLTQNGGTVDVQQTFMFHINDGNQVYHERQMLNGVIQASEVEVLFNGEKRKFRVRYADNRPHHFFCSAYIEMLKDV